MNSISQTLTMVFYYLAAYPQYAAVLRDEIESTVKEHGWTKTGLDAMSKLDSFVREVMRVSGIFTGGLSRIAMKDYVFSNGTFIPAGTRVVAPTGAIYADDSVYPNAKEFFPWRFYDLRNQAGENVQVVSTSTNFLSFGHGRYACPGRFFASMEMKTILAHVVVNYDVKMEKEGVIPPSTRIGHSCVPNTKAKVLLRKRFPEASESNGLH
ncbi:uncharacterized protein FIBRA_08589 [Fibroporia radiculosa]|uniref:Cytochrome P450 n=1 Tax=Fibroporia radiculosa TaxID=599839 RepID=J4GX28_9APHY|nr:uncharacterized protein FIBRA_08589 [Fibroporia radiculosa]CCM06335.1 predicted protein [Fibroporia radiculosa]